MIIEALAPRGITMMTRGLEAVQATHLDPAPSSSSAPSFLWFPSPSFPRLFYPAQD